MNYIPIIALGVVLHFIGAVITACIILKLDENKPKPQYPDEEECIELVSFVWELALLILLVFGVINFPVWLAKKICSHKLNKDDLDNI